MKKWIFGALLAPITSLFAAGEINTGDTAWMMMSTALVLLMTPVGLAMFYSGMTRSKSVINTYMMVLGAFAVSFIAWIVAGYSVAFGTTEGVLNNVIGGFGHIMLNGISYVDLASEELKQMYPKFIFVLFQGTFAAITVAIVAGSVIERMKFSTWLLFSFVWTIVVYAPITHMVWGGGYLFALGALDFAGGTVVHMNAGLAGLTLAILLGKRVGHTAELSHPSSIVLTAVGAGMLWFGWYGFNGGSAFGANAIAGVAFMTTTIAAAVSVVTWAIIEFMLYKKTTLYGSATGILAGLVAITPAAGFVSVGGAMVIGIVGAISAFAGVVLIKKKLGYDDTLDAFGVHFIAGLWGAIATGMLALNDKTLLWAGPLKDNDNRIGQVMVQLESVFWVGIYTLIGTIVVYYFVSWITGGGRVKLEEEELGLDLSFHGEKGFDV